MYDTPSTTKYTDLPPNSIEYSIIRPPPFELIRSNNEYYFS